MVTNSDWRPGKYLTEENLKVTDQYVRSMQEKGLGTWLYDEHLYPSGTAETKVLDGHKEFEATGLRELKLTGTGTGSFTLPVPNYTTKIVSARLETATGTQNIPVDTDGSAIVTTGADGSWTLRAYVEYPPMEGDRGFNIQANGVAAVNRKYINIIDADAVKRFIDITYQAYKDNFSPDVWGGVEAFFTDEPSLITRHHMDYNPDDSYILLPWEKTLPEKFQAKYGYDLMENLTSLFEGGETEHDKLVRQNFYSLIGDMVSEIYFGQISQWCEANGTNGSGHLLLEEELKYHVGLYGDVLKCFREMSYPGIDVLQVYPDSFTANQAGVCGTMLGAKFASSMAKWYHKKTVMAELCPVAPDANAWENDPKYVENAIGLMTMAYFGGVNHFNSYFTVKSPADGKKLNSYTSRIGYMLGGAKNDTRVAVYYPVETAQANYTFAHKNIWTPMPKLDTLNNKLAELSNKLLGAGVDYNFVAEKEITEAALTDGGLEINGNRCEMLILPYMEVIPLSVIEKINKAAEQGMTVIWVGDSADAKPTMGTSEAEHDAVAAAIAVHGGTLGIDSAVASAKGILSSKNINTLEAYSASASNGIYLSKYISKAGSNVYFLVNATGSDLADVSLVAPGKRFALYNPLSGKVTEVGGGDTIPINSYRGVFLVEQ